MRAYIVSATLIIASAACLLLTCSSSKSVCHDSGPKMIVEAATVAQVEFTEGCSHAISSDRASAPAPSATSPAAHWEPIWDRLRRTLHFRHGKQRRFTCLDKVERVGVIVQLAKRLAMARCLQSEGAARVHQNGYSAIVGMISMSLHIRLSPLWLLVFQIPFSSSNALHVLPFRPSGNGTTFWSCQHRTD